MELRHLRCFVAVAEELHFRRAAERLHVAQPAVSEQIRKLEQEIGVRLLERSHRMVELTPPGAAMLVEARRVLRQADVAIRVARNTRDKAKLRLRVGYLPDSLPEAVPRGIRQLVKTAPNVDVQLEAGELLPLIRDLRMERLDAVIGSVPAPTDGLRVTPLGFQDVISAVPTGHSQATNSALVIAWVGRGPFIVPRREANPAFNSAVVAMCHAAGIAPAFVEADSADQALLSVAGGAGIALLPNSVTERHTGSGVRFLPVRDASAAFASVALTDPARETPATVLLLRVLTWAMRATPLASAAASTRVAAMARLA